MALDNLPLPNAPQAAPAAEAPAFPSPFLEVIQGQLPAALVPPLSAEAPPDPVQEFAVGNFDKLLDAGLDYYEAKDSSTVFFNPSLLTEEQITEADTAGTLPTLVQPAAAPAPAEGALAGIPAPAAPAAIAASAPAPSGDVASAPLTRARLSNLQFSRNTSAIKPNPVPGQLAKRAI